MGRAKGQESEQVMREASTAPGNQKEKAAQGDMGVGRDW